MIKIVSTAGLAAATAAKVIAPKVMGAAAPAIMSTVVKVPLVPLAAKGVAVFVAPKLAGAAAIASGLAKVGLGSMAVGAVATTAAVPALAVATLGVVGLVARKAIFKV